MHCDDLLAVHWVQLTQQKNNGQSNHLCVGLMGQYFSPLETNGLSTVNGMKCLLCSFVGCVPCGIDQRCLH